VRIHPQTAAQTVRRDAREYVGDHGAPLAVHSADASSQVDRLRVVAKQAGGGSPHSSPRLARWVSQIGHLTGQTRDRPRHSLRTVFGGPGIAGEVITELKRLQTERCGLKWGYDCDPTVTVGGDLTVASKPTGLPRFSRVRLAAQAPERQHSVGRRGHAAGPAARSTVAQRDARRLRGTRPPDAPVNDTVSHCSLTSTAPTNGKAGATKIGPAMLFSLSMGGEDGGL
jgi:hypothetical protein